MFLIQIVLTIQLFCQTNCQDSAFDDKYVNSDKFICKMNLSVMKKEMCFSKIKVIKNDNPNFENGYLWQASFKKSQFFYVKSNNPKLEFLTFAIINDSEIKVMSRGIKIGMAKSDFITKMNLKKNICNTFTINSDSGFIEFLFDKDKLKQIKIDMGS